MAWHSILPASISFVETWITRICVLLAVIVIAPWLLLITYDLILYTIRTIFYDVPVIGGRAQNKPRPRAPSITQRPNGERRPTISLPLPNMPVLDGMGEGFRENGIEGAVEGLKNAIEKGIVDGLDGDAMESVGGMGDVNDGASGRGLGGDGDVDARLRKMGYDDSVAVED